MTESRGLCKKCQSIPETVIAGRGLQVALEHDFKSLKESVERRCFICTRVWDTLSEQQRTVAGRPTFMGIRYQLCLKTSSAIVAKLMCDPGDDLYDCDDYKVVGGWWRGETGHFAMLDPSSTFASLTPGRLNALQRDPQVGMVVTLTIYGIAFPIHEAVHLSNNTDDPACWSTVSKWIENCCTQHESCRTSQEADWTPARLVDISEYETGYVRVVATSHVPHLVGVRYLALSHCWGRKPFLVLDEHNQAELEKGVAISALAQNFQDALYTTHKLGFRYIWIDSLCIIQGSSKDWEEQAPIMNMIYRHAFLTIGALASSDAHGGFFRDRGQETARPFPFRFTTDEAGLVECLAIKSDFWDRDVRCAPLNQRAWVVQERILAPRTLYFGQTQLYWECQESHACEVFPDGIPVAFISDIRHPDAIDAMAVKAFRKTATCLADPALKRGGEDQEYWLDRWYESPYHVWNDILGSYVRCALTKPEDKLVAISGVAKDFANIIGDEYLAGLWRTNLIADLLWHVHEEELTGLYIPATRPAQYRAPSWSWASVDSSSIQTHHQCGEFLDVDEYVNILDINVVPRGCDSTGALSHACLRARGHLIMIRRKPVRDRNVVGTFGQFYPDMELEDVEGCSFFCWPLREYIRGEEMVNKLHGLVLALVKDGDEEYRSCCSHCTEILLFTRVGVFESEKGDPLRYLTMSKPENWSDWGGEKEHLWFPEDSPELEFAII